MTREIVRRENARALAAKIGGPAEFARKTEMSDSQVSQIIGKTPKKNIGNIIAKRIEDAFGLPCGWLDNSQLELSEDELHLIRLYRGVKTSGKNMVLANAESVYSELRDADLPSLDQEQIPSAVARK